jgi:acetoin utilization protein AcuC
VGEAIPDELPETAQDLLRALPVKALLPPHLLTTLRDAPREGPVRPEVLESLAYLARR